MALREELTTQGMWLFRWRSYAPLPALALIVVAAIQFQYPANSYSFHVGWEIVCLSVSLLGLAVRILTVGYAAPGTSGRNTRKQKANELNSTGIYTVVRHPLYLGNFLIGLGMTLFYLQWWLTFAYVLLFWLYYERIMFAEEEYLRGKFGDDYVEWSQRTPAFCPSFMNWRSPSQPFSWRAVLRAEYHAFALIVVCFSAIDLAEEIVGQGRVALDLHWMILCPLGLGIFLALKLCSRAKLL